MEAKLGVEYDYKTREFDLSTAIDECVEIQTGYIQVVDSTDIQTSIDVRPDKKQADKITLRRGYGLVIDPGTRRVFVSASAQAGKKITLLFSSDYKLFRLFEQAIPATEISNIIKWGGVDIDGSYPARIKPAGATQVTKTAQFTGTTPVILHTVTAGKTLYITGGSLSCRGSASSATRNRIMVRNDSDAEQYSLLKIYLDTTSPGDSLPLVLLVPIEVPAGWDICLAGGHADSEGDGCLQGWEA